MMADFAHDFRDGVDINLGVGYVNEKTIPVSCLVEAMQAVAGDGARYRQAFNYGNPAGSANLIASLSRFLGGTLSEKRLAIGACGATSILDALAEVMEPGIVVTSDPMYYIYSDALERKGFEVLAVPEDGEGIDLAALGRKLRERGVDPGRIAFFYVVTVNNPSCTILSNARRRALFEVAAGLSRQQDRSIPIFYDLAYELLLHDPAVEPFVSVMPADNLGIVYEVGTLSKVLRARAARSADERAGAEDQRRRLQRAALCPGDGELAAGPSHRRPVARRERGLPREGGCGARGHRTEPRGLSRRMPRRQRRFLLLSDVPRRGDASVFGLLPAAYAVHRGAPRDVHSGRVLRAPARRSGGSRPAPASPLLRIRGGAADSARARADAGSRVS
jgi:hypothetical protein